MTTSARGGAGASAGRVGDEARVESWLRVLLENSLDGVNICEYDTATQTRKLVLCNDRYAEMSGRSREELMAAPDLNELSREVEVPASFWQPMTSGQPCRGTSAWILPDGGERVYEWTAAPAFVEGKIYIVGIDRDITERRRNEARMQQAQKMEAVGRLAGGIAHDFRNQLTVILGYGRMLAQSLPDAETRAQAQEIVRAAQRSVRVTEQLLSLGRKQVLQAEVVDLRHIVEGLRESLQSLLGEAMHLEIDGDGGPTTALVDPRLFEQALVNLAINARDAMGADGTLTISVRPVVLEADFAQRHVGLAPGPHVLVAVRDTGEGMSEETAARAFEPFFTTKTDAKGTGLGLAMVYGFVAQSGGAVLLDSAPGKGAEFRLYFPPAEATAQREEGPPPASRPGPPADGQTLLVVEDRPQVRALVADTLRRQGYTVLEAGDGAAALRTAADHPGPIDALVTDVVMPGMHGVELAARLREERGNVRVLYLSAHPRPALRERGLCLGPARLLPKPFTPEELCQAVRDTLGAPT